MTDFYSQNRCVCSTRSHGPLLCAFCLSFHFKPSIGLHYAQQCFSWPKINEVLVDHVMDMDMVMDHGHGSWTWPWPWPWSWIMDMDMDMDMVSRGHE